MLKVYTVDYNGHAWLVGKEDTLKEAKRIARAAMKKSKGEFPCFIDDGEKVVADIR